MEKNFSAKRNSFSMLCHSDQARAVIYLYSNISQISALGETLYSIRKANDFTQPHTKMHIQTTYKPPALTIPKKHAHHSFHPMLFPGSSPHRNLHALAITYPLLLFTCRGFIIVISHPCLFLNLLQGYVFRTLSTNEVVFSELFMPMSNELLVVVEIFPLFGSTLLWPFFQRYN